MIPLPSDLLCRISSPLAGLSSSVSEILVSAQIIDNPSDTKWGLPAISTVGYGEITPRSFFGRLVTLPLLLFGLLLIALPSFVLGREFSIVWNEMAGGNTPRTPYTHSRHAFTQSEVVRFSPLLFLTTLNRALSESSFSRVLPSGCGTTQMVFTSYFTQIRMGLRR